MANRASWPGLVRLSGGVHLILGVGLAGLCLFAVQRLFESGRLANPTNLVIVGSGALIALFCVVVGYRLAFDRSNRYQSILPPLGWYALAVVFLVSAVAVSIVSLLDARYVGVVSAALGAALAYRCLKAGRQAAQRGTAGQVFPPGTSLVQVESMVPAGFTTGLELLNDNTTPMEFVVSILARYLDMDREQAIALMLKVHWDGGVLIPVEAMEAAEAMAAAISSDARAAGHQLVCRAVNARAAAK